MSPLRILHVVEASFAGVGRHVLDLAEGCAAAGDTVDVLYGTARAGGDFVTRLAEAPVREVGTMPGGRAPSPSDLSSGMAVRRFIRDNGPYDIVHAHASKAGGYTRAMGVGGAVRIYTPNALVTMSPELGRAQRTVYAAIENRLSRRTDGMIYVSGDEAEHGRSVGLRPRAERVITNGIPQPTLPTRREARSALGLPADGAVLGFVGRFETQKGVDRLLDAVAALSPRHDDVLVAIVGDGDDADVLRSQAMSLGLADRVRWLGTRRGQDAMPAFDLLALPSRYEGFPYVALEALWAGIRVVATDTCGLSTLLGDGSGGVVVGGGATDDVVASFAAALDRELDVVTSDPSGQAARAEAARSVVAGCTVQAMVDSTRAFYADVLVTRRTPVTGRNR